SRPFQPWKDQLVPALLLVRFVAVMLAAALVAAIGLAFVFGWVVVSPVLPRSWRLDWESAFQLDPLASPECPACQTRLALGPVDRQGHPFLTDQEREWAVPVQTSECPECRRSFSRFSRGKVWSGWRETPGAAADRG